MKHLEQTSCLIDNSLNARQICVVVDESITGLSEIVTKQNVSLESFS